MKTNGILVGDIAHLMMLVPTLYFKCSGHKQNNYYHCISVCTVSDMPLKSCVTLQVLWKRLYRKGTSFTEQCSLPQLQALINRSNVPMDPKKNVHAAHDFIEVKTNNNMLF